MYIAKIQKMSPLIPFQSEESIDKSLLVLGGGITGLTAAQEAARAGYYVNLVEKSGQLGGWLAKQYKSIPTKSPFRDLEETGIEELISELENNPLVRIYKSATTSKIVGAPGLFDVTLKSTENGTPSDEEMDKFRVGAIIQATGWKPIEISDDLPYGSYEDVIRNVDLEEIVKKHGKIVRPSDGKEVESIAFIQCGGTQDKNKHSYCSSICCLTSLKQAIYLREFQNNAKAYIFYEFIRTTGLYEDFYRRAQEDAGIFLTRAEVESVERDDSGSLVPRFI